MSAFVRLLESMSKVFQKFSSWTKATRCSSFQDPSYESYESYVFSRSVTVGSEISPSLLAPSFETSNTKPHMVFLRVLAMRQTQHRLVKPTKSRWWMKVNLIQLAYTCTHPFSSFRAQWRHAQAMSGCKVGQVVASPLL